MKRVALIQLKESPSGIRRIYAFSLLALVVTIAIALFSTVSVAGEVTKVAGKKISGKSDRLRMSLDHSKTGFPLTGAHSQAKCDACHRGGMFEGTPTRCELCHGVGSRIGATPKQQKHIPTAESCDRCHTSVVWAPARFNHLHVAPGTCATCHNNVMASGKSVNHVQTIAACDACHNNTTTWTTAIFVHDATTPGRCLGCHGGGGPGLARSARHVPGGAVQCDLCHASTKSFITDTIMNHAGVASVACANCHSGAYISENAQGQGANHIPTTVQCGACHKSFDAFKPATMDHVGTTGQCSTCHNGGFISANAQTKSANHVATTAQCDSCHKSTTAWTSAAFTHDASTVGKCNTCHKTGGTGLAMGSTHIPIGATQCDVCHTSSASFLTRNMNHAAVTAMPCITCHSGTYKSQNADSVGTTHIPLPGNAKACDACHTGTTAWTQRRMDHGGLTGQCATCHKGSFVSENALTYSATHAGGQAPAQCDTCHRSTSAWSGAKFAHDATTVGKCNTCHKTGGTGLALNTATHIPIGTLACDQCHTSSSSFTVYGASFHTVVTGISCATCHGGTYQSQGNNGGAQAKSAQHLRFEADLPAGSGKECNACHSSTTAWTVTNKNNKRG